jgi:hypothetical protein
MSARPQVGGCALRCRAAVATAAGCGDLPLWYKGASNLPWGVGCSAWGWLPPAGAWAPCCRPAGVLPRSRGAAGAGSARARFSGGRGALGRWWAAGLRCFPCAFGGVRSHRSFCSLACCFPCAFLVYCSCWWGAVGSTWWGSGGLVRCLSLRWVSWWFPVGLWWAALLRWAAAGCAAAVGWCASVSAWSSVAFGWSRTAGVGFTPVLWFAACRPASLSVSCRRRGRAGARSASSGRWGVSRGLRLRGFSVSVGGCGFGRGLRGGLFLCSPWLRGVHRLRAGCGSARLWGGWRCGPAGLAVLRRCFGAGLVAGRLVSGLVGGRLGSGPRPAGAPVGRLCSVGSGCGLRGRVRLLLRRRLSGLAPVLLSGRAARAAAGGLGAVGLAARRPGLPAGLVLAGLLCSARWPVVGLLPLPAGAGRAAAPVPFGGPRSCLAGAPALASLPSSSGGWPPLRRGPFSCFGAFSRRVPPSAPAPAASLRGRQDGRPRSCGLPRRRPALTPSSGGPPRRPRPQTARPASGVGSVLFTRRAILSYPAGFLWPLRVHHARQNRGLEAGPQTGPVKT